MISNGLALLYFGGGSFWLIWSLERAIARMVERPLPWWRRWILALPVILLLAANLDGILSFHAYVADHPGVAYARYDEYQAWDSDRLWRPALSLALVCPFVLGVPLGKIHWSMLKVWGGYLFWMFFVYGPFLLYCGVPLRD